MRLKHELRSLRHQREALEDQLERIHRQTSSRAGEGEEAVPTALQQQKDEVSGPALDCLSLFLEIGKVQLVVCLDSARMALHVLMLTFFGRVCLLGGNAGLGM